MMRKIRPGELHPGDVMQCDAYDGRERLLLSRGCVVGDAALIDALVSEGLVVDYEGDVATAASTLPPAWPVAGDESPEHLKALQSTSAVQILLYARRRLEDVVEDLRLPGFAEEIRRVAELVRRACGVSRDAALATALFERDGRYSIRHSLDVAVTCQVVGSTIELPQDDVSLAVSAALTMNLSVLQMQDALQSQKQTLSPQQHTVMQTHPHASAAMLKLRGVADKAWLDTVAAHHEAHDGSGYPARLKGDAIPLPAQLVALADVYCARVSSRRYRRGLRPQDALRALLQDDGKNADKALAAKFIQAIGVYPAGTPVRLANGEVAVVVGRGLQPTAPRVCSIVGADGMPLPSPVQRETLVNTYKIQALADWRDVGVIPRMRTLWGTAAALN